MNSGWPLFEMVTQAVVEKLGHEGSTEWQLVSTR
jgi:hypothetical protein